MEGIEFTVVAYNHSTPLPKGRIRRGPASQDVARILLPAVNYPFPSHINVVRGTVVQKGSPGEAPIAAANVHVRALPDATVEHGVRKGLVLTDEHGGFALPIRWLAERTETTELANAGATAISVRPVEGVAGYASIRIPGQGDEPFEVTQIDVTGSTRLLTLNRQLSAELQQGSKVHLFAFNIFVKPSGGDETPFPIELAEAYSKHHELVIQSP